MLSIAIVQFKPIIGAISENTGRMCRFLEEAAQAGANIAVFPELSLIGYPPLDYLYYAHLNDSLQKAQKTIAECCLKFDIACVYGSIELNINPGKQWFNVAVIQEPTSTQVYRKQLLPTYDIFDEARHFESSKQDFLDWTYLNTRFLISICEDIWCETDPLYHIHPVQNAMQKGAIDCLINISASPFSIGHDINRNRILTEVSRICKSPILYVNQVGGQTDILFDGGSGIFSNGTYISKATDFKEEILITALQSQNKTPNTAHGIEAMHDALIMGIRDFFNKLGFQKCVIGLSGGVDSALVAYLATKALGSKNVFGILLPAAYSSDHSVSDAIALAVSLGIQHITLPIEDTFQTALNAMGKEFNSLGFSVAEENMQSRIRGVMLMAWSNKMGNVLLNTTNKSEMAVGYGTLYGDMNGALSVLGDVYKTEVYDLCAYINQKTEIIPNSILTKAPSAELRPNQKDTDSLPDYAELDGILRLAIEGKAGKVEIIKAGYSEETVNKILQLVHRNEFKRFQAAPVLRVSSLAFGAGRQMPLVAKSVWE